MKATLIILENDRDHAQAKALLEELMGSDDVADRARMAAQARLIEAYERSRGQAYAARPSNLSDGAARSLARGLGASSGYVEPGTFA